MGTSTYLPTLHGTRLNFSRKKAVFAALACQVVSSTQSANQVPGTRLLGQINTITTARSFSSDLHLIPALVAWAITVSRQTLTPIPFTGIAAKLAFAQNVGFSISYTPGCALVNDINLAYISGYKKLKTIGAIAGSLRYFSPG